MKQYNFQEEANNFFLKYSFIAVGIVDNRQKITLFRIFNDKRIIQRLSAEAIRSLGSMLVINLTNSDENWFVDKSIDTISLQNLLAVALETPIKDKVYATVLRKHCRLDIESIDLNKNEADYNSLFASEVFWHRIGSLVKECFETLQKKGLLYFLSLQIRVTPILVHMIRDGYPFDPITVGTVVESMTTEQKERIPEALRTNSNSIVWLPTRIRAIGTVSFRIVAYHYPVMSLPRALSRCMLPRVGDYLVSYDLVSSQVIMIACLSGEISLIKAYLQGEDLYSNLAKLCLGKVQISDEERSIFKTMILMTVYGAGIETITAKLNSKSSYIAESTVTEYRMKLKEVISKVFSLMDLVKEQSVITLPSGRSWEYNKTISNHSRFAIMIQSLESEILRKAMITISSEIKKFCHSEIYLCVHDSIIMDVAKDERKEISFIVQNAFASAMQEYFPFLTKVNIKEEFYE